MSLEGASTARLPTSTSMGMRRDPSRLSDTTFDLLVVGAGIHGACIAWDACLRGLTVAVVDRGDFGAATSANSLRIVHGGLRYLARGDFRRMLESIRERSTLLRIAPGLVAPLPVLIPTYREPSKGRLALGSALLVNDLVSRTRNRGLRPDRVIPRGRLISRHECLRLFPWFRGDGLTGGALWYDARLRHPERLTLSFVRSAAERGAVAANYVRVDRLLVREGGVRGAMVTDLAGGAQFEVRAHTVVVAAGPWTPEILAGTVGVGHRVPLPGRALAVNVRIDRPIAQVAVGARARSGVDQDPVGGGHRFLFAAPQEGSTLLGTWYTAAPIGDPRAVVEDGVRRLVREFSQTCPGLGLTPGDVAGYQWGWLPLKGPDERGKATSLAERPRIVDHGTDNLRHLLSVEGVKYTTARSVGERVVDWVFRDLGRASPACRTAEVLLEGADDEGLFRMGGTLGRADVQRAVHEEMALKLSDIVFRRSSVGTHAPLSRAALSETARLAGAELGWDALRQEAEIEEVVRQPGVLLATAEPVG
jgi:glycerol-3-phosphate dehydrogenase